MKIRASIVADAFCALHNDKYTKFQPCNNFVFRAVSNLWNPLKIIAHFIWQSYLTRLTEETKQTTKRNRYSSLKAFFNYVRNSIDLEIDNPCDTPIPRKVFRGRRPDQWEIIEKELIDEIIFRAQNPRNRIMLELMARARPGMRVGEVLKIRPIDIQNRKITSLHPKSGKESEVD